jgi:hypothetical protein
MKRSNDGSETDVDSTINIKISDTEGEKESSKVLIIFIDRFFFSPSDDNFQLKLKRSQNLIDKSFVFISRNQNRSEFLDNSFNMAQMYGDCLYRSENSAFDLCDHEIVSRENCYLFLK